jgi:hypothetical protein
LLSCSQQEGNDREELAMIHAAASRAKTWNNQLCQRRFFEKLWINSFERAPKSVPA